MSATSPSRPPKSSPPTKRAPPSPERKSASSTSPPTAPESLVGKQVSTDAKGNAYWHLYLHRAADSHSVDLMPGATARRLLRRHDRRRHQGLLHDQRAAAGERRRRRKRRHLRGRGRAEPEPHPAPRLDQIRRQRSNDDGCNPSNEPTTWNSPRRRRQMRRARLRRRCRSGRRRRYLLLPQPRATRRRPRARRPAQPLRRRAGRTPQLRRHHRHLGW